MADNSTILREYLISLGFKVDEKEGKKFDDGLKNWDKRADKLGKSLIGVGTAAVAMVSTFAYSMEKLYYASRRTDSAVGSMRALDYAARNVGVKNVQESLEAVARNLRSNPGLTGLLNSLGVQVKGRDKSDVLVDLVTQLKKMPFFVAEKYANLFGIDPDTLFMLQDGLDKLKAANAQRKEMAAAFGIDQDKAAKASVDIANSWRETYEVLGLFKDTLAIALLPKLLEVSAVSREVLSDWIKIVQQGDIWSRLLEGVGLKPTGGGVEMSKESKERLGISEGESTAARTGVTGWIRGKYEDFMRSAGSKKYARPIANEASVDTAQDDAAFKTGGTPPPSVAAPSSAPVAAPSGGTLADGGPAPGPKASKAEVARQAAAAEKAAPLFAKLEKQYGLPKGWLGRVWAQESRRGGSMLSSAGAQGHFQFMPATAKQYGLSDPNDLDQSATAAAKMYSNLLKKYDGDQNKAAAAYNWGEGNVDRKGLGRAPAETRGYMAAIAGGGGQAAGSFTQTNHISISGVSDPNQAAKAVGAEINNANSDVVRNMKPRVQ
jgi:hypothetical protein